MVFNDLYDVDENYIVIDHQYVFLSVEVGEGELRSHYIRLGTKPVRDETDEHDDGIYEHNVENLEIGKGSGIRSRTLYITSDIANNMFLGNVTITYTLAGGDPDPKIIIKRIAFNGNQAIAVNAKFELI